MENFINSVVEIWTKNLDWPILKLKLWKKPCAYNHSNYYVADQAFI